MKKLIVTLISFLLAGAAADPAQQRITAYFDAFNKDAAAMTEFIREHVAASSLAQRGIPERLEVYGEMKNDLGSLKQVAIVGERATSNERTVVVKATAGTGGTLTFTFRLEPEPPHKILSLGVERGESQGQEAGPIDATARIGTVRKYMDGLEAYGFTGALLIVQDGKPLLAEGYGDADRVKKIANTTDTLYDVGSLVKDFTKIAIAQLEAAGKLTTEDPLRRFFFRSPGGQRGDHDPATARPSRRPAHRLRTGCREGHQRGAPPPVRTRAAAVQAGRALPVLQSGLQPARGHHRAAQRPVVRSLREGEHLRPRRHEGHRLRPAEVAGRAPRARLR